MKTPNTLRGKLLLAALVVEAVMLTLLVGNSLRLLHQTLTDEARRHAEQLVPILQSALTAPLLQSDRATVQAILDESDRVEGLIYLAVTDQQGIVISAAGWPASKPLPKPETAISLLDKEDGSARHDLVSPLVFAGQKLGALHIGLDLSPIVVARKAMLTQGVVLALIELTLTALLLALIGAWLTRQLLSLEKAAATLEQGEFSPLPAPPDDDIGNLVRAFNTLGASVGARIAAEQRLRLMASVFENAQEGVMITDPDGRIVEVNEAFSHITGYSRDDALGQTPSLLRSGKHAQEFYAQMWEAIQRYGSWQGEIFNRRKDGEIFPELLTVSAVRDERGVLRHYTSVFSDISTFKTQQERLERLAHFDPLTGLPNRALLADRLDMALAQAKRSSRRVGVALLDLDGFKPINDHHGHAAGDSILEEVGRRLLAAVRETDTVARLGGDEFVIVLGNLDEIGQARITLERVLATLGRPYAIDGEVAALSASIGLAMYPDDDANADTLLRHADHAMYSAKQSGRNRWHLFDPELDREHKTRLATLSRISSALPRGELVLHYQPKVDFRASQVVGAEALIRWQHPEHGLLPPSEFLPLTDGSDLEIPISEWVIRTALTQTLEWSRAGLDLSVSVNLPARHLQSDHFASFIADTLTDFPPELHSRLQLEVLETAALGDLHSISMKMETCAALGVSFALDDFGTGYASLAYLRRLPTNLIKIDQSFVGGMLDDPNDLAIVEAVIGLGEAFSHPVIAEGVETIEHAILLAHLGCRQAQGFGIAKPMPADAIPVWVARWKPPAALSSAARQILSRGDLPLAQSMSQHRRWLAIIDEQLRTERAKADPRQIALAICPLGRWLKGDGKRNYEALAEFIELRSCHRALHAHAETCLALLRKGEMIAARESAELFRQSEEALRLATMTMIRRITGADQPGYSPDFFVI